MNIGSEMKLVYLILFIFYICGQCVTDPIYFDCYKDKCIRGLQHCVDADRRCFPCQDMTHDCGTANMPRDCDSFCAGLKLATVQDDLKSSSNENLSLKENVQLLNQSLDATLKELKNLKSASEHLLRENNELKLTLNTSKEFVIILHRNYSKETAKLESNLKECQDDKVIVIVLIVVSVTCAILVAVMVYMCVQRRKHTRGKRYSSVSNKEEETAMVDKHQDEGSDKMKRAPSADSAVNLSDSSSHITTDASDNESSGGPSGNDKSLVGKTRGEPAVAYKNPQPNQQAEPSVGRCGDIPAKYTMGESNLNVNADNVQGEEEDNCLRPDTPAVLKGIPPSTSQNNGIQNKYMYS